MNYIGFPLNRFLPDNGSEMLLKLLTKKSTRFFLVSKKGTAVVLKDPARVRVAFFNSFDLQKVGIAPDLSADLDDEGNGEAVFFMGVSPMSSNVFTAKDSHKNSIATFCVYLSNLESERLTKLSSPSQNLKLLGMRDIGWEIDQSETAMLSYAWALSAVHEKQRFDPRSGSKTKLEPGGRHRAFTKGEKKRTVYPRTDPVVIMLIRSPDHKKILLARGKRYKLRKGLYSCIAGFIETGESVEEAASREAWEESGVTLQDVKLWKSQPWSVTAANPQLMIGVLATARDTKITLHDDENEDVRWFDRKEVENMLKLSLEVKDSALYEGGQLRCPGPYAIAHHLILAWSQENRTKMKQKRACAMGLVMMSCVIAYLARSRL